MRLLVPLTLLVALALALAACGDDDDGTPTSTEPIVDGGGGVTPAPTISQPEPAQALDAELAEPANGAIEVLLQDSLFVPNNLHVPLGEAVTIRMTNADAVGHTFRVAGPDGVYTTEDDAVLDSIAAGDVGELTFNGATPGLYTYRCDFHPGSMGGAILVD
jgi:plastocyanin